MDVVDIAQSFQRFSEHWSPKIVGALNGQHVKLAKLKGEFVWHAHENEDELFLVVKGTLRIRLEDRELTLRPGEFTIIPKGVRHLPIAEEEVEVILLEPANTNSTGGVKDPRSSDGVWL
jgi:mannose-6-phosphate isomerase-like protein (cupin superfamily)